MLDALRFVQGAVAKKDFVPALTHFSIANGQVRGYNGTIALCSPIDLNLTASPKALPFVNAIKTCNDTIQLHLTPAGRLSVKSGKFKAFVECTAEPFPEVLPEGDKIELKGDLLVHLKKLSKFIADDASRPWARGILLRGASAYATNNIILVEQWLGYDFPVQVNLPEAAVDELVRIGAEPTHLQIAPNSCTFHFEGDRWLRTQVLSTEWPDAGRILNRDCEPKAFPEGMFDSVRSLLPFLEVDGGFYLEPGRVSTSRVADEAGASQTVEQLETTGRFNAKQFLLLEDVASKIDLGMTPTPFYGDKLRGVIIGMRS